MFEIREKKNSRTSTCKGKIFKCTRNIFKNKKGQWISTIKMTPQKRKSCSDCSYCGSLNDDLQEDLYYNEVLSLDIRPDIEVGALYKLTIVDEMYDWETGYIDDFNVAFVKI